MPNLFMPRLPERTLPGRETETRTNAAGPLDTRSGWGSPTSSEPVSERTKDYRPRGLLCETRLAAQALDELSAWLRDSRSSDGAGLLFGTVNDGLANIEELRPLPLPNGLESGSAIGVRLGNALDEFNLLREPDSLQLIGWCCVRPAGDMRELGAELAFHNQRFRRSTDLLLVLQALHSQIVSARLYARSCDLPLSAAHHRAAPITLPDEILSINSAPAAPSRPTDGDLYLNPQRPDLNPYPAGNEVETVYRKPKKINNLPIPAIRKRRLHTALAGLQRGLVTCLSAVFTWLSSGFAWFLSGFKWISSVFNRVRGFPPALGSRLFALLIRCMAAVRAAAAAAKAKKVPQMASGTLVLLAVMAGVYAMYSHKIFSGIFERHSTAGRSSNGSLRMRIEQRKDGILVGWNRDTPAIRSARGAVLQIEDGSLSHAIKLEPVQLANGSIFYTPSTADVNFRLTVYGSDGSKVTDGVRELDGTKPAALGETAKLQPAQTQMAAGTDKTSSQPVETKVVNPPAAPKIVNPPAARAREVASPGKDVIAKLSANQQLATANPATSPPITERKQSQPVAKPDVSVGGAASRSTSAPIPRASAKLHIPTSPQSAVLLARNPVILAKPPYYVPPRPVKTVLPNLTLFDRSLLAGIGRIQVEVDIDEWGRVLSARPLNLDQDVNYQVMASVLSAARQWVFNPAQRGGRNVAARHAIVFRFAGS